MTTDQDKIDRDWRVAAATVLPVELLLSLLVNLSALRQRRLLHEAAESAAKPQPTAPETT